MQLWSCLGLGKENFQYIRVGLPDLKTERSDKPASSAVHLGKKIGHHFKGFCVVVLIRYSFNLKRFAITGPAENAFAGLYPLV